MLYGIYGAIRAVCFFTVTGARLPFTAVTRVKITEEANVANENEHALNVRACHGFARLAADDANSDGQTGTE